MNRPERSMPTLRRLCDFHGIYGCVRCGTSEGLERAHVIDRFLGGLDNLVNLRPLCSQCHRLQPSFAPGQEDEALEWFGKQGSPLVAIVNQFLAAEAARRGITVDELATEWLAA